MNPYILVADDDADDRFLLQNAFQEEKIPNPVIYFRDGVELVDHLHKQQNDESLTPGLIILDLNMPRKDGRQALKEIKSNPEWRFIPVLVFTTSEAEKDIEESYQLGANSYIVKPSDYTKLTDLIRSIRDFWLGSVTLPRRSMINQSL
ncbi:response regulator [Cytophagaceae bacterium YF14B1]|uniref:Response regulator n=1 Tax=Xanthocytophaga flava TaxID=3048013 RepID=A0AAE3U759_9BACT|nr:response regulator [Xanthocytophaga flavus]MDJ1482056.1 response regulator [Xanthocytophaga flavus]